MSIFGLNALGVRSRVVTTALALVLYLGMLWQPSQLQSMQPRPCLKQSQYSFRHFDCLQLHLTLLTDGSYSSLSLARIHLASCSTEVALDDCFLETSGVWNLISSRTGICILLDFLGLDLFFGFFSLSNTWLNILFCPTEGSTVILMSLPVTVICPKLELVVIYTFRGLSLQLGHF